MVVSSEGQSVDEEEGDGGGRQGVVDGVYRIQESAVVFPSSASGSAAACALACSPAPFHA